MGRKPLHLVCAIAALAAGSALAQQPVQPLPKVGGCPLGYYSSGGYCVPSSGGNTRGAIEKSGAGCPLGFYSSGSYCVSSPSNEREAIQKSGKGCPLGWYSSSGYCVKSR
ncbi:MAG: hypothetical protein RLZZ206_2966 [Cyanobacteriota bacterium]